MHRLAIIPWVRRLLPAAWRTSAPEVTGDGGLGIDLLPDGLHRLPVDSPVALILQDGPAYGLWVQALLADALQSGPVFLLADDPAWVDRLLQNSPLQDAHAQGHLKIWLLSEVLPQRKPGALLYAVHAELCQVGLTEQHALFVVGTPSTGFGHSVAQIQQWGNQIRNRCRSRTRPMVFGFRSSEVDAVLGPLRSVADVFQHVATLGTDAGRPVLFADRWNGTSGPIFQARYGLKKNADTGRLSYDGSQARGHTQKLVEAPDQYLVLATRGAVAGQHGVPADWQLVDHAKDLPEATASALAATVLLHSGPAVHMDKLFRLVHQLRLNHPRTLKIVVRESHEKLRSNIEQALLHLGANKVVYRELGFSRLVRQIADMSSDTYSRSVNPDYSSALGDFMPNPVRGYLPAPLFCEAVQSMLDRTGRMGLAHSFVQLTMQNHVAHLDAIQACLANRNGDILTADHNALYVFMFSCAEPDIEQALPRLFALPTTELFATQVSDSSLEGMRTMLRALRDRARKGLPDYSMQLTPRAAIQAAPAPAKPAAKDNGAAGVVAAVPKTVPKTADAPAPPPPLTVRRKPIERYPPQTGTGDRHAV